MAINYPQFQKLTAADMGGLGGFDLGQAIRSGLENYKAFHQARFEPQKLEYENKIKEAQAKYAMQQELAKLQHYQAGTSSLQQSMAEKRQSAERRNYLQQLLENPNMPISNQGSGHPGHMTPHGYEGSLTGVPAQDLYANTGEDREAEQEAIDRIDRANNTGENESSLPAVPKFAQNLSQALKPKENPVVKSQLQRLEEIYNNLPLYRKDLEALGYKPGSSKNFSPTNTMKDIQALIDVNSGFVPGTKRTQRFSNPQEQQQYKDAYEHTMQLKEETANALNEQRKRRASGLPQGQEYINNEQGEHIAISRPLVEREKKEYGGRNYFNVVYPDILKSLSYYSGEGSITRFHNDISNYKNSPKAQKRIINYLSAIQLLPSTMVKENATVGGANTNQVYNRLVKSLQSSDIPTKLEDVEIQFRLPKDAKLKAGLQFQNTLNKATQASEKIPARVTEYLNGNKKGHIYNKKTKRLEEVTVSPQNWDEFTKAGGY
jgi:hypothetical protein